LRHELRAKGYLAEPLPYRPLARRGRRPLRGWSTV